MSKDNMDPVSCRAFCDGCNTLRLEHFFSLMFEYILGTKSTVDPLGGLLNCIDGARWLDLPSESKVYGSHFTLVWDKKKHYEWSKAISHNNLPYRILQCANITISLITICHKHIYANN